MTIVGKTIKAVLDANDNRKIYLAFTDGSYACIGGCCHNYVTEVICINESLEFYENVYNEDSGDYEPSQNVKDFLNKCQIQV